MVVDIDGPDLHLGQLVLKDVALYPPISDRICRSTGTDKKMRTKEEVDDDRRTVGHNQYVPYHASTRTGAAC